VEMLILIKCLFINLELRYLGDYSFSVSPLYKIHDCTNVNTIPNFMFFN